MLGAGAAQPHGPCGPTAGCPGLLSKNIQRDGGAKPPAFLNGSKAPWFFHRKHSSLEARGTSLEPKWRPNPEHDRNSAKSNIPFCPRTDDYSHGLASNRPRLRILRPRMASKLTCGADCSRVRGCSRQSLGVFVIPRLCGATDVSTKSQKIIVLGT